MSERKFNRVCATCEHEQTQFPNCVGCQERFCLRIKNAQTNDEMKTSLNCPDDDLAKAIVLLLAAPKEWLPEITALIELFKDAACVECTALPGGQVRCTLTMRQ